MNSISDFKLPDDHPLSFKHIVKLQDQIAGLDPKDICFPYMHRIPEILCEIDNKRHNCHSITALQSYEYLSIEELRFLNYAKRNAKPILGELKFINNYKETKFRATEKLIKKNDRKYQIDLLTTDEIDRIKLYYNCYNPVSDDSFRCFMKDYNHKNSGLQNFALQENKKLLFNLNSVNNANNFLANGSINPFQKASNMQSPNMIQNLQTNNLSFNLNNANQVNSHLSNPAANLNPFANIADIKSTNLPNISNQENNNFILKKLPEVTINSTNNLVNNQVKNVINPQCK